MPVAVTSAAGVIALLNEPQSQLQSFALTKLNSLVDTFWAEISESVRRIEQLYEDESFANRQLAALVASKVYYHLGEFNDALEFALGAGEMFNVNETSEFVHTLVSKSIDRYIALTTEKTTKIDPRLVSIVDRMFERCFANGAYKQAVGIALESGRVDIFERAIDSAPDTAAMISYCLQLSMTVVQTKQLRNTILRILSEKSLSLPEPDFTSVCQCLIYLDDSEGVAKTLSELLAGKHLSSNTETAIQRGTLVAYQLAFDLFESATEHFLSRVSQSLSPSSTTSSTSSTATATTTATTTTTTTTTTTKIDTSTPLGKILAILSGEITIELELEFLFRNNHSDLLILKNTKTAVQRNSICHTGTVIANSLMHAGTGSDIFLRQNLDWLARATYWSKFNAIASLGVIHKGQIKESMTLLSPYLPVEGDPGANPYPEGGSLYALGLIHADSGKSVVPYLLKQLRASYVDARNAGSGESDDAVKPVEIVKHGACLGLGIAAMASNNSEVFQELYNVLSMDSAVASETAGIALGLVMLGSGDGPSLEQLFDYAHETRHEKIIRGLALGIALTLYEREEFADSYIERLMADKDALLRFGGMLTVSLAYAGTGNNKAIRRLLHVAVSDVSDDVRRTAVIGLGFVLFRNPEQVPGIVSLLSESYNPHVRYGSALALGISCAATGSTAAMELLEPLLNDPVDFVRQGAMIAFAMILIQQSDSQSNNKSATMRKHFEKVISEKHEDVMAKFGAILSQGIIEAGGRNVTLSLQTRIGHTNTSAVVGLLLFTQYWFWHPLVHFISLSFTPTCVIALNKNLQMPKVQLKSNAKPSQFAYPPALTPPKVETKEKVTTATLSYTKVKGSKRKAAAAAAAAAAANKADASSASAPSSPTPSKDSPAPMDVVSSSTTSAATAAGDSTTTSGTATTKPAEPEPDFVLLENPARVTPQQFKVVSFDTGAENRYTPVVKGTLQCGVVIVDDKTPTEPEDIIKSSVPKLGNASNSIGDEGDEPDPPQPFEYTE